MFTSQCWKKEENFLIREMKKRWKVLKVMNKIDLPFFISSARPRKPHKKLWEITRRRGKSFFLYFSFLIKCPFVTSSFGKLNNRSIDSKNSSPSIWILDMDSGEGKSFYPMEFDHQHGIWNFYFSVAISTRKKGVENFGFLILFWASILIWKIFFLAKSSIFQAPSFSL